MTKAKYYEHGGFRFMFIPEGSPFKGLLQTEYPEVGPYASNIDLRSSRSRNGYAREASQIWGLSEEDLKATLVHLCSTRIEEVSAARDTEQNPQEVPQEEEVSGEEVNERIGKPGVLNRLVEDMGNFSRVVREREMLKLLALISLSAQLDLAPNGKPIGANSILTAEPGRGKNYLCDAVARVIPEEFYFAFESSSAKSLYYAAENDPAFLKHRWIYPNEAEATDLLVEMFRPLLSGGLAKHLTVNSDASGRNTGREYTIEGPITLTIPTVRNKLDSQLQSRMLVAGLEDYEGRVAEHSGAVSGLLSRNYIGTDHTPQIRVWQAALRSLTSIRRVIVPEDHPDFRLDSDQVSYGARLWTNVLGLMCTHAWLEQRNRKIVTLNDGKNAIMATPEDYEAAYEIFKDTCERSVINFSEIHRKILDAVYALTREVREKAGTEYYFSPGFAQRKIEDMSRTLHGKAYVRQASISENKTFLVKSAKILWEPSGGGLALVKDAEPSWWKKGDALDGFPKPEQVREWWSKDGAPKTTDHADHCAEGDHTTCGNALSADRRVTDHVQAKGDQPVWLLGEDDREAIGAHREVADHENGLPKPDGSDEAEDIGNIGVSESTQNELSADRESPTGSAGDHDHRRIQEVVHECRELFRKEPECIPKDIYDDKALYSEAECLYWELPLHVDPDPDEIFQALKIILREGTETLARDS